MADLLLDPVTITAILSLLLLVAAIFAYRRVLCLPDSLGAGKWLERFVIPLVLMQFGFLMLASTPAVVNRLLQYTENLVQSNQRCIEESTPLVVLSGGVSSSVRSAEDLASVYPATYVRMVEARNLIGRQSATPYAIYLVGGSMRRGIAESDVMQHFFELTGVDPNRLITERLSANTAESAVALARVFETNGGEGDSAKAPKIRLLTSALHMARSQAVFASQGFDVCPVHVDRLAIPNVSWWVLLPQISVLKKFDPLLHEWVGILFYKFKGYL